MTTEVIGWLATAVLLATLTRQVYSQWQSQSTEGVSSWLFVGQLVASALFFTYSVLLGNYVFAASNAMLIVTAAFGQWILRVNRARGLRAGRARSGSTDPADRTAP